MDFFQQIDNIALLEPAAHFELFRSISNALNSKDSGIQAVGRNHLIKVIDVWEDVPSTLKPKNFAVNFYFSICEIYISICHIEIFSVNAIPN